MQHHRQFISEGNAKAESSGSQSQLHIGIGLGDLKIAHAWVLPPRDLDLDLVKLRPKHCFCSVLSFGLLFFNLTSILELDNSKA